VDQIDPRDWLRLFGDTAEGYDYYQVLEASRLEGFAFSYVLVSAGERVELIAPLFWSDFDLGIGVEGAPRKLLAAGRRVFPRLLKARTLFCGSPFGEEGAIGLTESTADSGALLAELLRAMETVCRRQGLSFLLFKDFPAGRRALLSGLARHGFFQGDSFPNVEVPLPFPTLAAYVESLSANARKDLRRKIRHAEAAGQLRVEVVDDVTALIEPVYALYLATYHAGTVRFEKLTREYFLETGRRLAGRAKFFLFFSGERLVGFNLCFHHGDQLIDKFIGLDYAVARPLNLYFYTWYENVRWCLAHGIRRYQVGQTDHGAKVRLGGKLVPLYFYARHRNPLLNGALRLAARFLAPEA
jgi:predicted N-acyltransferase